MQPATLFSDYDQTLQALREARAGQEAALRAATRAAVEAVEAATSAEARSFRRARRRLRDALRKDARFLFDRPGYQSFRRERDAERDGGRHAEVPELLREPAHVVAFEGYRVSYQEDYNDEHEFLTRCATTKVQVAMRSGTVSVPLAERHPTHRHFAPTPPYLDRVANKVRRLVDGGTFPAGAPNGGRRDRYEGLDAIVEEVSCMLLFALPWLRPPSVRVRVRWP
ncbi:MAG: hypothetical protein HY909_14665 [Deltaproteobacteria bacterium]|nr:hypothetical protein [Deltaproteobacteria bacterium]